MNYARYSNLVRDGYIIVEIEGGVVSDVNKPDKTEWNGKIVILDYDTEGGDPEQFTMITLGPKESKKSSYFSEY